jgi:hypothetical protein
MRRPRQIRDVGIARWPLDRRATIAAGNGDSIIRNAVIQRGRFNVISEHPLSGYPSIIHDEIMAPCVGGKLR